MEWNPNNYADCARFVADLGVPVVELLSPQAGERILDLGCGDGELTKTLLEYGCEVVAVDSSPEMIDAARSLGLNALVMDGAALQFENEFDAVFSNAALHWMGNLDSVAAGVWRALRPGGRFVGEFGGHGNVAAIVTALENALSSRCLPIPRPWRFPTQADYQQLLEGSGFSVDSMHLFSRPTVLPGDIRDWLNTFARPFTSALSDADGDELLAEVADSLRPALQNDNGETTADYVRLRFAATKASDDVANAGTSPRRGENAVGESDTT